MMVFRKGGIIKQNERWTFMGQPIEVVSFYKYLGIVFTSKLRWTLARKTLAAQASKALGALYIFSYKSGRLPINIMFNLFDKTVLPILLYGAEIWGTEYSECIERVQITFVKKILGVGSTTTNAAVLYETGRYPLAYHYHNKCIKFWLKLLTLPENRLPKSCYFVLKSLDENGKWTWVTSVRNLLQELGFGYVWAAQGVGNQDVFFTIFEERVKEYLRRGLRHTISNSTKTALYSTFKIMFGPELYIQSVVVYRHRVALSKLRLANHMLIIEHGRHTGLEIADRVCPLCKLGNLDVLDDEYHFVMQCISFQELRERYLSQHIVNNDYINFIDIMSTEQVQIQQRLAAYVHHAFERRRLLLS